MAKTTLKHKVALVLGADSPLGRAAALQLAREGCRVIIAGFDEQKIELLDELIRNKKGDAILAVLPRNLDRALDILRPLRDAQGHLHFIVNALAAAEPPSDKPNEPGDDARALHEKILELVTGRGVVRFVFVWPETQGAVPEFGPASAWRCVMRARNLQTESEHGEDTTLVRAASAADSLVNLIQCPPGACPVEVWLEPKEAKG